MYRLKTVCTCNVPGLWTLNIFAYDRYLRWGTLTKHDREPLFGHGDTFDRGLPVAISAFQSSLIVFLLSLCGRWGLCYSIADGRGVPPHSKGKIPKFRNKYSQKRNIGVSVPISTFMRLWEIYIFPRLVCLFCWRKYVDWSWGYINRSQTHECWNRGCDRAIPRKGMHKGDFRCSAFKRA